VALASKLLLLCGVVGLGLTLGGYTCETVNNRAMVEDIKNTLSNSLNTEVNSLKEQLKSEIASELKEQEKKLLNAEYQEDSFVKFTFSYPRTWQVSHWEDGVRFASGGSDEYLAVFVQKMGHPVLPEMVTTTKFFNYPARRLSDADRRDGTQKYEVLEIYPKGYKNTDEIIEISGDPKNFEELIKNFSEFKVK